MGDKALCKVFRKRALAHFTTSVKKKENAIVTHEGSTTKLFKEIIYKNCSKLVRLSLLDTSNLFSYLQARLVPILQSA